MKKHYLRKKFSMIFAGVFFALIVIMLIGDNFFLERFYEYRKEHVLKNAYLEIDRYLQEGGSFSSVFPEEGVESGTGSAVTRYISNLTEKENISVIIMDNTSSRSYTSSANPNALLRRLSSYILGKSGDKRESLFRGENYTIVKTEGRGDEGGYMESWGYFSDNSTSFIMSMPLSSLSEAVSVFNSFLLFLGLITMGLGVIIVYIASYEVTKPIQELAQLSLKMSKLDFSARFEGDSSDEIATLGNSMNILSERLEETICDLKKANNELLSDIENKTLIDKRRQEFVANVSHELKTPIALIMGYAEGLSEGLCEDSESRTYYSNVILDEAKRMNHMVKDLMNLSAIEQGKDLPDFTLLDFSKLLQGVISNMDILLKQEEIQLEVDIPKELYLYGDEFKIEEVLMNYLQNAIHHVKEPKQISIYTENRGKNLVEVHVRNTGNPIPKEDIDHIFEKFYKVDKAHTRAYGGSGLGLSIVKAIMDSHHQECGVKNTLTGVDFWFTLEKREKYHSFVPYRYGNPASRRKENKGETREERNNYFNVKKVNL